MLISRMIIDKNIKRKVNFTAETSQQKNTDDIKRLEVFGRGCKDLSIYKKRQNMSGLHGSRLVAALWAYHFVGLTVLSPFVAMFMTC